MACIELGMGKIGFQPLSQCIYFFRGLLSVEQVETTDNGMNWPRTSFQHILQATMSTARKQESAYIKSQLMTEIVGDVISVGILHVEIPISPGHRVNLRQPALPPGLPKNMGYRIDAVGYFTGMLYQDESWVAYLRPLRSNAMQMTSFGEELATQGIGRDDDFCLLVDGHEMLQASGMVAMSVRDEHIVNLAEVYT